MSRFSRFSALGRRSIPVPPVGYVGAAAASLVFRILQSLLYGAIAMALAKGQGVILEYAAAIRLATVAVTPVIIARTLIWFAPSEPAWYVRWPIAIAITVAYIVFGVRVLAAVPKDVAASRV